MTLWQRQWGWGIAGLVCGYGFTRIGHVFLKQRPGDIQ
jgi:hypothetical protein